MKKWPQDERFIECALVLHSHTFTGIIFLAVASVEIWSFVESSTQTSLQQQPNLLFLLITRSYAALQATELAWIVRQGHSLSSTF